MGIDALVRSYRSAQPQPGIPRVSGPPGRMEVWRRQFRANCSLTSRFRSASEFPHRGSVAVTKVTAPRVQPLQDRLQGRSSTVNSAF